MRRVLGYCLVSLVAAGGVWSATSGGNGSTVISDPPSVDEQPHGSATGAAAQVVFSLPSMTVPAFPARSVAVINP